MSKQISAIYEEGRFRPLEPVELAEGEKLELILLTPEVTTDNQQTPAQILASIAALPLEGKDDAFSGLYHDAILYSNHQAA
ncbi:MAG: antitoxin family protein [Acidobacteria bacterium]|nr:antitoxin family protein [Acidobacteriota bacterium]